MKTPKPRHALTVPGAIVLSAMVALTCALWSISSISLLPPKIAPDRFQVGGAATRVLLDAPRSWIVDQHKSATNFDGLTKHAALLSNIVASQPVMELVQRRLGIPGRSISAMSRSTANVPQALREPDSEQRATQIAAAKTPYHLELQADPGRPILNIYARAPSPAAAERLADVAVAAARVDLARRQAQAGVTPRGRIELTQLGRARGGVISGGTRPQIALLTFLLTFALSLAVILALRRAPPPLRQTGARPAASGARLADWPRTTRVLPWLVAAFMVVLWLVPFNAIQLTASLPFDLKFDRLVLPFIVLVWILAVASGGAHAPRIRFTWIHAGVGAFVIVAFLSVLLNAGQLAHTLELDLAAKKLVLLLSYVTFFVIVASTVRRTEVPAFMRYTLGLATLCALGTIWEYRFGYNVFTDGSRKLLPGLFQVGTTDSAAVDDIGRALTQGPAEHSLEAVTMLAMALPIALVGAMRPGHWRSRLLYGLATCVILAASIATFRKSALLVPLSVVVTLTCFRPREMLRMAPLGVVVLAAVHVLAPGSFGSVLGQLDASRLGVATISDRAADYDAVRPDLWSHLAFGRGYGSYDHVSYRILDSESLGRLVETGIVGLLAYLLMIASIVLVARRVIRARDPIWAPPALAIAAAAVAFLVVSFLFDVMSFPHAPYILLCLAGLLAAMVGRDAEDGARPQTSLRHADEFRRGPPAARRPVERARPQQRVGAGG